MCLNGTSPFPFMMLYNDEYRIKPQSVVRTLINYFIFSIASCSSFVCLSASCLSYSLDVARYAFKNKTGNMLNNQTKSAQALTTDLGLI